MGRFGYLKPDDQVDLRLDEEFYVMGNDDFKALADQSLPSKVIPLRSRLTYDLRSIDWGHRDAAATLKALPRHILMNVLVAMNELGVPVDAFESMSVDDVVDNIRRAARAHGWDTLSADERLACPAASDEEENEEESKGDDEDDSTVKEPDTERAEDGKDSEEEEEEDDDDAEEDEDEEEAPAAPAGPARKRATPAAKKAVKPSKP